MTMSPIFSISVDARPVPPRRCLAICMVSVDAPERLSWSRRLASARTIAALSMPSCVKKFLSSEARMALTKSGGISATSLIRMRCSGEEMQATGLEILGDEHRLLGKVGAVVQPRDRVPVDAQVVVDLFGVVGIDRLDDRFESDVAEDEQRDDHADGDEEAPDDPAEEAQDRPRQRQQDALEALSAAVPHDLFRPSKAANGYCP